MICRVIDGAAAGGKDDGSLMPHPYLGAQINSVTRRPTLLMFWFPRSASIVLLRCQLFFPCSQAVVSSLEGYALFGAFSSTATLHAFAGHIAGHVSQRSTQQKGPPECHTQAFALLLLDGCLSRSSVSLQQTRLRQ